MISQFNYDSKNIEIIDENKTNNEFSNISQCQIAGTTEYAIIERIDKKKLKDELSKLPLPNLNKTFQHYINAYKKDIQFLKKYKHENILKVTDFINREKEIIIIKEYADMNLLNYVKKEKKRSLMSKEIRFIFNQINDALKVFRKNKKIHTCLCSENIFIKFKDKGIVSNEYIVKISDFGCLSKLEIQSKIQLYTENKIQYMAPEVFKLKEGDEQNTIDKADLWSLGVLLYFLRFNQLPFESELFKIYKIIPDSKDPLLTDLINRLLVTDPNERISWNDYFQHKYFDITEDEKKEIIEKKRIEREQLIFKGPNEEEKIGKNGKMIITYNNGDKYEGDFVNNIKEGKGVYYYENGDKYEGDFIQDKKEGYGVYFYKNGEKYEGEFKGGKKHGFGKYYYIDGDRYEGEFKFGVADGRGIYYYSDGEKYIGDYFNDMKNGHGIYFYSNGTKYIGEFKDGKKNGRGFLFDKEGIKIKELLFEFNVKKKIIEEEDKLTYMSELDEIPNNEINGKRVKTYSTGDKYEGEYKNGLKQGRGIYYYSNGDQYVGDFINDKKEGNGIYYYNNGDKYEGQFYNNEKNGKGTYYYCDGDKFIGNFKNNYIEGEGKYFYNNGDKYFGDYKNDKKEGIGIYYYSNGWRFEGEFKKGKKSGSGIIIKKNGEFYEVKYLDDVLLEKGPKLLDYDGALKIREKRKTDTDCILNYEGDIDFDGKKR